MVTEMDCPSYFDHGCSCAPMILPYSEPYEHNERFGISQLSTQPRLVDIIAAIPHEYKDLLVPRLRAKPIRTASGVFCFN